MHQNINIQIMHVYISSLAGTAVVGKLSLKAAAELYGFIPGTVHACMHEHEQAAGEQRPPLCNRCNRI